MGYKLFDLNNIKLSRGSGYQLHLYPIYTPHPIHPSQHRIISTPKSQASHYHHMAAPSASSLLPTFVASLLFISAAYAQPAPAPTAPGPLDIIAILQKAGQYDTFAHLLNQTQVVNQINNQANNSNDGITLFAPTDNAFQNLPTGTLNNLSDNQKVQLLLYHVLPKCYTLQNLQTISNPVRTLASGQSAFGLNFTGQASQVNVSTGIVKVPIYNTVRKECPLAVYQVDKVLLPVEFTEPEPPAASPAPKTGGAATSNGSSSAAPATPAGNGSGAGKMGFGFGLASGIWFLCTWILI